jgi:glycosyltransferase involved in cell wall biosynthesis
VRETSLALQAAGHEVVVLCSSQGDDTPLASNLNVVEVPPARRKYLGYDLRNFIQNFPLYREALRLHEKYRFEAIYERSALYSALGKRLEDRLGLPRILEMNAFLTVEQENKLHFLGLARWFEHRLARQAPAVVVVSQPLVDSLVNIGVPRERIFIMPMAVNVDHFSPDAAGGDAVREQWGLGERYVIGYVGSLSGWHGIRMLPEMADMLLRLRDDFVILVVGGEPEQVAKYRRHVAERNLDSHLVFTGSVSYDEVPACLAAMDVALVPDTNYWTCPTKMFEYQASGVPTIAPRYPAVVNAMEHGREGLLFDPQDTDAAVRCILELADAPERRAEMGRLARERVVATRSWQRNVESILRLFEGIREGQLPPHDHI